MPAQAGIQGDVVLASGHASWIPACAGMTLLPSFKFKLTDY
jgi:hypothetical protein